MAVPERSPVQAVEDLQSGARLATTGDPDVHTIGMIMLEPADLDADNLKLQEYDSYILVAKALLRDEADVGFFLKDSFVELSDLIRKQMRVLVSSQISVVHHALLVGPQLQPRFAELQGKLLEMKAASRGAGVLESMGLEGWEVMSEEQTEFMIDLIDTLVI